MAFWDGEHWRPLSPARAQRRRRTTADRVATVVMIVGLAALMLTTSGTRATLPAVAFDPGTGAKGTKVHASATGLAPSTKVQLEWDGSPDGMPRARISGRGKLSVSFTVPQSNDGYHSVTVKVVTGSGRKKVSVVAGTVLAAGVFVVSQAAVPSPTATGSLPSSPSPTADAGSPSPTSTGSASPSGTPSGSPSPSAPEPSATSSVTPGPTSASATPSASPPPDSTPDPATWQVVVNDQFETGGLPSHWVAYDGPYGSGPKNCATPSHVSVSGGSLRMLMRYESSGRCGAGWYTAGLYDKTANSIDQRITVRFRVVSNGVVAHRIIPMRWPTGGTWPQDGEEDYCEGSVLTGCSTFLHYSTANLQVSHGYVFDMTQWNTLRFERRDHVVRAFINDMSSPVWTYVGTSTTLPDTVKHVVLQQECKATGCPTGQSGTEEIQIDWITIEVPA